MVSISPFTAASRVNSVVEHEEVQWDWETLALEVFEDDLRPIILFDGQCNLCNGGVNFALDHDAEGNFRFVSLHSKVGKSLLLRAGRNPGDINNIVLALPNGQALSKSDAVLAIAQGLDPLLMKSMGHLGFLIPPIIRDVLLKVVSENRFRFGEVYDSCRIDFDGEFDRRFIEDPE